MKKTLNKQEKYPLELSEVISEIVRNSKLNDRIKQYLNYKVEELKGKQHYVNWASITQFILSLIIIIGVFVLTYFDKLHGQVAATLIGTIVGYLFGKTRK